MARSELGHLCTEADTPVAAAPLARRAQWCLAGCSQGVEHMTGLASAMLTEYDQKNYAAWEAYHAAQAVATEQVTP